MMIVMSIKQNEKRYYFLSNYNSVNTFLDVVMNQFMNSVRLLSKLSLFQYLYILDFDYRQSIQLSLV